MAVHAVNNNAHPAPVQHAAPPKPPVQHAEQKEPEHKPAPGKKVDIKT